MTQRREVSALILAAGEGTRLGGGGKAFLRHGGRSLLEIALLHAGTCAEQILVGLRAAHFEADLREARAVVDALPQLGARVEFLACGSTRLATFLALLARARGAWVVVHDVARPFATEADFFHVLRTARAGGETGAAALGRRILPRDSMALVAETADGAARLSVILPREELVALQTPLAFRTALLRRVEESSASDGADDQCISAWVAAQGHAVEIVWGENENHKITYPQDKGWLSPL